jgi:hypothetical protein
MTGRTRLRSMQLSLTARERIRAILAANRAERTPDPLLQAGTPREQEREFRRLATMVQACASHGTAVTLVLDRAARELHWLHACVTLMGVTETWIRPALAYLATQPDPPPDAPGHDVAVACLGSLLQLVAPSDPDEADTEPASSVEQLARQLRGDAEAVWRELRALELTLERADQTLEGSVMEDEVMARLARTRATVEAIARDLAADDAPLRLEEPSAALLRSTRQLLQVP